MPDRSDVVVALCLDDDDEEDGEDDADDGGAAFATLRLRETSQIYRQHTSGHHKQ